MDVHDDRSSRFRLNVPRHTCHQCYIKWHTLSKIPGVSWRHHVSTTIPAYSIHKTLHITPWGKKINGIQIVCLWWSIEPGQIAYRCVPSCLLKYHALHHLEIMFNNEYEWEHHSGCPVECVTEVRERCDSNDVSECCASS